MKRFDTVVMLCVFDDLRGGVVDEAHTKMRA